MSVRCGDSNYYKGTQKLARRERQTTGIYGSNDAGEVMTPSYFFSSSEVNSDNFQVKYT